MPPPGVCLSIIDKRSRDSGMGTPDNPVRFRGQDFNHLHQESLRRRQRFYDYEFPPENSSIGEGLLSPQDMEMVEWKRPMKLVQQPQLFLNGVSRFDFGQGMLGDCWFLAAVGALTFQENLLKQVMPSDQGFQNDYAGIFHFRFWRFGEWVDVVIDDKLPTIKGRLIFVHSQTAEEFWPALLEKAYAKVCGSYVDLKAGNVFEAITDFMGGVHITFMLPETPSQFWDVLHRAVKHKALIGGGTPQGPTKTNRVLPNGLVEGHAYTVTGVKQVRLTDGQTERLVRLWNPWGDGEWKGDWSDSSQLWQKVTVEDRTMCLKIDDNGEFWMSTEDFQNNFSSVDICCLYPEFLDGYPSRWDSSYHEGRWVEGTTAGGSKDFPGTFWTNPQYLVKIRETDTQQSEHQCANMLVALMQKSDKKFRHLHSNQYIGFAVFEVPTEFQGQKGKLQAAFFRNNKPVEGTKTFVNAREISKFFYLKPGEYIIVPSTSDPNQPASFILRIFSKLETSTRESSAQDHVSLSKVSYATRDAVENHHAVFNQYSDQYKEVDAEQLQRLLNERISNGGFGLETCRSIVAMMDLSVSGKLNPSEFQRLWKRIVTYMDVFFKSEVSETGRLSLRELRNAIQLLGVSLSDDMLNLMALRHGSSAGELSLESFIFLMLRLDWMTNRISIKALNCLVENEIFRSLSDGKGMTLQQKEWMQIAVYS